MENIDFKALSAGLMKISEGFAILADFTESIGSTADAVSALIAQPEKPALPAAESTKAQKKVTFEAVRGALAGKAAKGHKAEVKAILKKYGATCLSGLESHPELFPDIMADAEEIGNAG